MRHPTDFLRVHVGIVTIVIVVLLLFVLLLLLYVIVDIVIIVIDFVITSSRNVAGRIRRNMAWFVWPVWRCFPATIVGGLLLCASPSVALVLLSYALTLRRLLYLCLWFSSVSL